MSSTLDIFVIYSVLAFIFEDGRGVLSGFLFGYISSMKINYIFHQQNRFKIALRVEITLCLPNDNFELNLLSKYS